MTHAAITGWGKCMPPAVLSNADLATFLDTDDAWITQRTGVHERRVAHVTGIELARVASLRALACAALAATDLDLVVYGSCSNDEHIPNSASGLAVVLGAGNAAAMDVNTACTSFLYGLSTATAMIRTGVVRTALVVGVEMISPFMDWRNRNVAVLFGDGCAAVVLQASEFVAKRAEIPMDRVFLTVHKYGNMSSATVPVALVEALEAGRVRPGALLLTPAFGGGLTFCSHVIRWGERVTPRDGSDAELAPCDRSALDIVHGYLQRRDPRGRSALGLQPRSLL